MYRTVTILLAAWLTPLLAIAQEQDWKIYRYPDAGFAIQFPVPPEMHKGTFSTADGASLPETTYTARQDGIVYTMQIIDYSGTHADGTSTIAQTEKSLGASGKVSVAIDARINREYGRELSVNGADGSRSAVALFFVHGNLFLLTGKSLPPNAIARSGDAIRFQQSLQFIGDRAGFGRFGQ